MRSYAYAENIASLADEANVYREVSLKKEWAGVESAHVWYAHVKPNQKTVRSILHMYVKMGPVFNLKEVIW